MDRPLLPSPDMAPPSVSHLSVAQKTELWADLVNSCEAVMLANLKSQYASDEQVRAAYRDWYRRKMEDHDRHQVAFLENLSRRESRHGN